MSALNFTGERYLPECPREMLYEHYARYAMALKIVVGKKVLDCACGEGYGSAILASAAEEVLGVDLSDAAIAHARASYIKSNLRFEVGNAAMLRLPEASFDVIVSFETLEHLLEQEQMLAGFKRLLKPGGVLLISSPDKASYSDATGYQNEFHVKELYRHEFEALLAKNFSHHRLFAQALNFQSMIWDLSASTIHRTELSYLTNTSHISEGLAQTPMYYIAAASENKATIESVSDLFCFSDQSQSIYAHYNSEIRKGIQAAAVIADLEAENAALKAKIQSLL